MLEQLRARLRELLDLRAAQDDAIQTIVTAAEAEDRAELTADETAKFAEARAALKDLDGQIEPVQIQIRELEELAEARAKAHAISLPVGSSPSIRVGSEPLTYRPDVRNDFFVDLYASKHGDPAATERIQRHRVEVGTETRAADGTTGSFGALVVPQYLTDMFAPIVRSGRPYLNTVRNLTLPADGMTMYVPRGNTASTVLAQTSQLTAVSNTTYGVSDLTVPVVTVGGQQVVSRQALERGTGVAEVLMSDLMSAYSTRSNLLALSGSGANGQPWGLLNTTNIATTNEIACTATTQTTVVSKINDAIQRINTNRFAPAEVIVMHPRRWAAIANTTDSSGRPLVDLQGGGSGQNILGGGAAAAYGQVVGSISGVPVVTDAGIPTTGNGTWATDSIIVTRASDTMFWEEPGAPRSVRLDEVLADTLGVRFVVFGYAAFTAERYTNSTYLITGTGLVAPTF